jgi:hypothetical protein
MPRRRLVAASTLVVALLVPAVALATTYIYLGKGVGKAYLGQNAHSAATILSPGYHFSKKDTNYSYTVYHWYVGKKMSNGRYPIELYARSDRRVYRFQINSSSYPTVKGVRVGSVGTATALRAKYPSIKGPYTSGTYKRYQLRHTSYTPDRFTEFYCRNGKVAYIIVRK